MKIKKTIRVVLLVLATLIVTACVGLYLFADKAIKIGVEVGGTKALGVPVALQDVDLSIVAGKVEIKNLVVDNPSGYQHKTMLELGTAMVDLDVVSAMSETVNIDEILLKNVSVVLEQKGLTNNIQEVLDGMSTGSTEPKSQEDTGQAKPSKKLVIKKLHISEVAVKIKLLPIPGKKDTLTMTLAPITMTNIGADDKVDMGILASKVLLAIVAGIAQSGAGILPADIIGPMGDTLKEFSAITEDVLEQSRKVLKEGLKTTDKLGEDVKKLGEDLQKGVNNLFGPSDKDDK